MRCHFDSLLLRISWNSPELTLDPPRRVSSLMLKSPINLIACQAWIGSNVTPGLNQLRSLHRTIRYSNRSQLVGVATRTPSESSPNSDAG